MLQVQKGDVIRSYDFKPMFGRADCYVEGIVEEVNNTEQYFQAYKITVVSDVFGGDAIQKGTPGCRIGETVFVPYRVDFQEYSGRVMNLSR